MSKIRLWGHPKSINVQKVLWTLDELDLEFQGIDAGGKFGRVKDADYLTLNPNGLVPTLEDEGAVIWESNAILRYLAAKYGAAPFLPTDLAQRARADAWTDWHSSTLWPSVRALVVQLVRTPEAERDGSVIERSVRDASAAIGILDRELTRKRFVAGDDFTFGDIPLGAAVQRWFNLPIERPAAHSVRAWYDQISRRSGFKRWVDLPLY
ncbi:MAG: glutathione S-transferase family protein [Pseudomonadota bacterium]